MANPGIAFSTLGRMRGEIAADSPLLGGGLRPAAGTGEAPGPPEPGFSDVFSAACGRPVESEDIFHLALEYIFEGYLLHYGASRLLESDDDNFRLLAGDYMYARGLNNIASLDDLFHITILADLIKLCSYIHCEKVDSSAALKSWCLATLCLAGRAAGNMKKSDKCRKGIDEFMENTWNKGIDRSMLNSLLKNASAALPDEKSREVESLLSDIKNACTARKTEA